MRILENWQYKYIEKCLFNYKHLVNSQLETERKIVMAIKEALNYFNNTQHESMMRYFYFDRQKYASKYTVTGHFNWVCREKVCTEEPNGYVIRREIIYRIAMNCFQLGLFKNTIDK